MQKNSTPNDDSNIYSFEQVVTMKHIHTLLKAFIPMSKYKGQMEEEIAEYIRSLPYIQPGDIEDFACKHTLTTFCRDLESLMPEVRVALLLFGTEHMDKGIVTLAIGAAPSVPSEFYHFFASHDFVNLSGGLGLKPEFKGTNVFPDIPNSSMSQSFKDHFATYGVQSMFEHVFFHNEDIHAIFCFYSSDPYRTLSEKEKRLLEVQVKAYHKELQRLINRTVEKSPMIKMFHLPQTSTSAPKGSWKSEDDKS